MKKLLFGLLMVVSLYSNAQPSITWQKCLGGNGNEIAYSIQQTTDGGYVFIGKTNTTSTNGNVTGNFGGYDLWVVKLDNLNQIQFQFSLGGSADDNGVSIIQTTDGGFILAGNTYSNDGVVSGNHGQLDIWVIKLNSQGSIQWKKCLGGSLNESARSIQQTTDGGYILTGSASSTNGDVSGNHGIIDVWVVKLNSLGTIQWNKCFGGDSGASLGSYIQQTIDGGYILIGYTVANNDDVSGNHGQGDIWVIKLNSQGIIRWKKCLGGSLYEYGNKIQQTIDGGYILTGSTNSNDGDVSGNHGEEDIWVLKLNDLGDIQWQKCLGGSSTENGSSIQQTTDGGFILTCSARSTNGDVIGNHGSDDVWVVKLTNLGAIQWQKCLGGSEGEGGTSIQQTSDGGFIIAGYTYSSNGDVSGYRNNGDVWVVKLSSLPQVVLDTNGITIKWSGTNVPSPYLIQADPRGTGLEWFAIVNNSTKNNITNYAKGIQSGRTYFTPPGSSTPIPFSNIVTTLVTDMSLMFNNTNSFNQNIGSWDVSNVTNMEDMISDAPAFNQPIGSWNMSQVTSMSRMFVSASSFNQNIETWNVSSVTNMSYMFFNANAFNQPVDSWNVSNVTDMSGMFYLANAFKQPIGSWNVGKVSDMSDMFNNSGLSTANYDTTLIGWSTISPNETPLRTTVNFNAGTSKYCNSASARNILTSAPNNWTITDSGLDCTSLGTKEFEAISYKLYPNPVVSFLNVKIDSKLINQTYFILDTLGRFVLNGQLNEVDNAINIEQLSEGIYYIKLSDNNSTKFIKL